MTERDGKTGRREDSGEKRRMDYKWILKRVTDRNGRWGGERKEDGDDETGRESAQHTLTSTQTNELFAFHSVERIPLQSPNSPLEIKTNCHRYLFKSPLSQLYMCAGCRFPHKV